jgi:hypothetical protein
MAQLSFMEVAATMAALGRPTLLLEKTRFCHSIALRKQIMGNFGDAMIRRINDGAH